MSPDGGESTPPLEAKTSESAISPLDYHAYPECASAVEVQVGKNDDRAALDDLFRQGTRSLRGQRCC
jgi:hypothetical protein